MMDEGEMLCALLRNLGLKARVQKRAKKHGRKVAVVILDGVLKPKLRRADR